MPGFAWTELYTMPIDLRKFYFKCVCNKIQTFNEEVQQANKKTNTTTPRIPRKK